MSFRVLQNENHDLCGMYSVGHMANSSFDANYVLYGICRILSYSVVVIAVQIDWFYSTLTSIDNTWHLGCQLAFSKSDQNLYFMK